MNPASFSVPTIAAVATAAINPAVPTNGARDEAREVNPPAAALAAFPSTDVRLPERAATASDPIIFFPIAPISNFTRLPIPVISAIFTARNAFPRKAAILPAVPPSSNPSNRPPIVVLIASMTCHRCFPQSI